MGKRNVQLKQVQPVGEQPPLKLDLGSGKNKREGFIGVDQYQLPGVDVVLNFASQTWPWSDSSVDEAHCSHVIEHLTNLGGRWERVFFFNELYRVLKPGAKCTLIVPHWCSARYYGDPTHKEPLSEWAFFYLLKSWRKDNAPHCDYEQTKGPQSFTCDFDVTYGYSMHPGIQTRNVEYQQNALTFWKDAAQDIIATMVARK